MPAQIAAIEQAVPIGLDLQGERVIDAVVDCERSDGERPQGHRPAVGQVVRRADIQRARHEEPRLLAHLGGARAEIYGNVSIDQIDKPDVIGMHVADEHAEQRAVARRPEAWDVGQKLGLPRQGTHWHAGVEDDPLPLLRDLDAGPAHLPSASEDADLHGLGVE